MCPGKILIIASKDFDFYKGGAKKVATRANKKRKWKPFLARQYKPASTPTHIAHLYLPNKTLLGKK